MGVAQPVLVCAVLLGLLTSSSSAPWQLEENDQNAVATQELAAALDYLQNNGNDEDAAWRNDMLNWIPNGPMQDTRNNQFKKEDDADETSLSKKASFKAPLCHFKICNIGRKRGFYRKSNGNLLRRL